MEPMEVNDIELKLQSEYLKYIHEEHAKLAQLVAWHEHELLLTSIILCGIMVVQLGLIWEVGRVRKAVKK